MGGEGLSLIPGGFDPQRPVKRPKRETQLPLQSLHIVYAYLVRRAEQQTRRPLIRGVWHG
jgi:hypothetical protein